MHGLDSGEIFRVDQLPRPENVDFVRPNCTNEIESQGEIKQKENFGIHGVTSNAANSSKRRCAKSTALKRYGARKSCPAT